MRPVLAALLATTTLAACFPQEPAGALVEELPEFLPEIDDPMPEQNGSSSSATEASGGVSLTGSASAGVAGGT